MKLSSPKPKWRRRGCIAVCQRRRRSDASLKFGGGTVIAAVTRGARKSESERRLKLAASRGERRKTTNAVEKECKGPERWLRWERSRNRGTEAGVISERWDGRAGELVVLQGTWQEPRSSPDRQGCFSQRGSRPT
ncbi:hypothetical protein N658DRAFT_343272 [Parathielavia hyrcaniae]|uniref:Uncharacterized protein n=1 Tax=Parathielavia hyrcaniae TaxID=113614 RepID=A0AAN6Q2Y2_9PEZI|nr:hypothetical protein N658DRAFT_343272 [Parathielavia hyrcaniae]